MTRKNIFAVLLLTCLRVRSQSVLQLEDCTCVPISQCSLLQQESLQGIAECENRLHICCTEQNIIPKASPNFQAATCGRRNPSGLHFELENAILESQYAEFPWMIEISAEKNNNIFGRPTYSYLGGGSLITPYAVLTAAHKMTDINVTQLRVRAGEWERNSVYEPNLHQDRKVIEIIRHEDYNPTHGFNGIAMLILESPINLEDHINTICLPPRNFNFTGSQCFVTGWGADARDYSNIKPVDILKKIDLPVIDDQVCQEQLRKTRLGALFYLHPSFMCAGGEKDKDACFGDGGSPLVCPIPNSVDKYYLAGIVVGGIACGLDQVPGIYIDVSKFLPWINENIANYIQNFR